MYKYIYCGIPTGNCQLNHHSGTDKSVPYSYGFWCRQNRYILKQCSAYGADIITPHLPQAASSPQAPQGEDIWVRCKIQQCTHIARGTHGFIRSLEPGNQRYAYQCKLNSPLKKRAASTVSTAVPNRDIAKNVSVQPQFAFKKSCNMGTCVVKYIFVLNFD